MPGINSSSRHHHQHHHLITSRTQFQARQKRSRTTSQTSATQTRSSSATTAKTTPFPPSTKKASSAPVHLLLCDSSHLGERFVSSVLVTSGLLLFSELEVLAASNDELLLSLALLALQPKGHLLSGFGLRFNAFLHEKQQQRQCRNQDFSKERSEQRQVNANGHFKRQRPLD